MATTKSLISLFAFGALVACGSSGGGGGGPTGGDTTSPADTTTPPPGDTTTPPPGDTTTPPKDEGSGPSDTNVTPPPDTSKPDTSKPSDDTIDGAEALLENTATDGDLDTTGDVDYFSFEGKKGDLVDVFIQAQDVAFDKDTIDAVITLYGPDKEPLAFNDDPTPRTTNDSDILTILPADGTYYVRVEECWTWIEANSVAGASCAEPKDKTNTAYKIEALVFDTTLPFFTKDAEKGNTEADATVVSYGKNTQGKYVQSILYGMFEDGSDVDVYEVTVPADMPADGGRPGADFGMALNGPDGNGSTAKPGKIRIALKSAPPEVLAEVDPTKGELSPPLTFGEAYYLYVTRASVTPGANDFYIVIHTAGAVNPPEKEEAANDLPETAEVLTAAASDDMKFFVEGDLIDGAKDVDHFSVTVPAGAKSLTAVCGALTNGSGLKGLSIAVLDETGGGIAGATSKEKADTNAYVEALPVDAAKKFIIKVSADSQDPDVKGAYYRCGFAFSAE